MCSGGAGGKMSCVKAPLAMGPAYTKGFGPVKLITV